MKPTRALLLMINHHLGNFVVSLPFLDALSSACAAPADIVVDERFVCLARLLPHAGAIIPYVQKHRRGSRIKQAAAFAGMLRSLAGSRYRTVLDVGGGIQSVTLATATLAPARIGLEKSRRSWLYTERLPPDAGEHASDRFLPFLRRMGMDKPPRLRLRPDSGSVARLKELVPAARAGARYAAYHPGAGYAFRQWPEDRFSQVADLLHAQHRLDAVFIGAPGEEVFLDGIIARMKHRDHAARLVAELDVVLALLDGAAILVSNESGPTHLAAATETPIVTIFGPSKESKWRPCRETNVTILRGMVCPPECRWGACKNDLRCVMDVQVNDVVTAAAKYLQMLDAGC